MFKLFSNYRQNELKYDIITLVKEICMKNILIVGPARAGKTTLSRVLNKKYGYSIVNLDNIVGALGKSYPILDIKQSGDDEKTSQILGPFISNYLNELSSGANFYNGCNYVIEGTHVDFEKVIPNLNTKKYVVLGLTYNKITPQMLYDNMKKYDTEDDWTYWCRDDELRANAEYFVERNKIFDKKFKQFKIKTFDVSDNRERAFDDILKWIETQINEK